MRRLTGKERTLIFLDESGFIVAADASLNWGNCSYFELYAEKW